MDYALVLGGSRGLGWATVRKLHSEGIPVIAVHRDFKKDLPAIKRRFKGLATAQTPFHAIHKDGVRNVDGILDEIKKILGPGDSIRILVHSIARGNLKPMATAGGADILTPGDFSATAEAMAVNLYTWVCRLLEEGLLAAQTQVVAFTSEGNKKVIPGYGAVAAAKASLEAIVRQMAVEFAPQGLRANCIQAGVADTDSLRQIPGSGRIVEETIRRNPYGRLTQPSEVADAVFLLTLEEASWITGNVLKVDGGESLC